MSQPSQMTESQAELAKQRSNELAARMKQSMLVFQKSRKDAAYWKLSMELYGALAEALNIDPAEVKRCWRENRSDDYERIGLYSVFGETDDVVRFAVYPLRMKKDWLVDVLMKPEKFADCAFATFLSQNMTSNRQLTIMAMIGKDPWFFSGNGSKRVCRAYPRLSIPLYGMNLVGSVRSLYVAENCVNQV